jgi:hypothetical protein
VLIDNHPEAIRVMARRLKEASPVLHGCASLASVAG